MHESSVREGDATRAVRMLSSPLTRKQIIACARLDGDSIIHLNAVHRFATRVSLPSAWKSPVE